MKPMKCIVLTLYSFFGGETNWCIDLLIHSITFFDIYWYEIKYKTQRRKALLYGHDEKNI